MIRHEELKELEAEWGVREDVVERDYVIGWLLWGIGAEAQLRDSWVFKGGTCLHKCYFETYRFSEDLDFTVLPGGPIQPGDVEAALEPVLARVADASGIDLGTRRLAVRPRNAPLSTVARLYYIGPRRAPTPGLVQIDLLGTEKVVRPTVRAAVSHPYSDALPSPAEVRCYCLTELFAEKTRALGERCRPRDLYDVVNLYRREDLRPDRRDLLRALREKCLSKGIDVPTLDAVSDAPKRGELESEWANMLGHQLPELPPIEGFVSALGEFFSWLEGAAMPARLVPDEQLPDKGRSPDAGG